MTAHPAFKSTTRVCAICGKAVLNKPDGSIESTFGFRSILLRLGIDGDKAHPSCLVAKVKSEATK